MDEALELLIFVEDEGTTREWSYNLWPSSLERWETVDLEDQEAGLKLVRFLVLSKLGGQDDELADLLMDSCEPEEFLMDGVPETLCLDIPKLALVNQIVDKVYACLCTSVVEMGIRTIH